MFTFYDGVTYSILFTAGAFLTLFLYIGIIQKRSRADRCSCHPDRLSSVNIVSSELRVGYSIYNTWLGRYIHNMKLASAIANSAPHTKTSQIRVGKNCTVLPVAFLEDNYSYLIACHVTGHVAVVDCGDATAIETAMTRLTLPDGCPKQQLTTILTTHGHWDHDGGNRDLLSDYPNLNIVGGLGDGVNYCTHRVNDNDQIMVGKLKFRCIWTPCHTPYHMCYYLETTSLSSEAVATVLFSGDTLFVGGVGKFWEGQAKDMKYSLDKIKKLPPTTLIFGGHEYAVNNLTFNCFAEPNNNDIKIKLKECQQRRAELLQNVPTLLKDEYKYNSFLRAKNITIKVEDDQSNKIGDYEINCLYTLRRAKDTNKGPSLRQQ
jgi:hydroxyacylglutathione hydrolase